MHYAGNVVNGRFFLKADVSVTFQSYDVAFSFDYSVDQNVPSGVLDQRHDTFLDVLVLPWTKCDLVSEMVDERIHTISLCRQRHSLSFSGQSADFFEHVEFVDCYLFGHFCI